MNELLTFFKKGLIITFLIILALFLLSKVKEILEWLTFSLACLIGLIILAILLLPLIALIWGIVYLTTK